MTIPRKILVIRNDKLGDFMLAWPAFALLKKQYPEARIIALVPAYTQDMVQLCPSIDEVMIDDQRQSTLSDARHLSLKIRTAEIDTSISFYSEIRTALALWLARVPTRVAPATKLAQIFINRRLTQKRSQSARPEHIYNSDLVRYYVKTQGDAAVSDVQPPYLTFDPDEMQARRRHYCDQHSIQMDCRLVIVHPGSGGSAINLSLEQYADLIRKVSANTQTLHLHFIITAGPGEADAAQSLSSLLTGIPHNVYQSSQGLVEFCNFIGISELFISGSTGTLHVAGALNLNTAAFYPARRSATALRWQTLNSEDRRIAFSPASYSDKNDMSTLDIKQCAKDITEKFFVAPQ